MGSFSRGQEAPSLLRLMVITDDGETVRGSRVLGHVRRDGAVHDRALRVVDGAAIVGSSSEAATEEEVFEEVLTHLRSEATEQDEIGQTLT